jgi:tetratricopeptide (TPR) repeat protein
VDQNFAPALVAASEAEQARFDLSGAGFSTGAQLIRVMSALVNRARIRFGTGDTAGATVDADAAAAAAPTMRRRCCAGSSRSPGRRGWARSDWKARRRTPSGEPHLGLGLVHFRGNRVNDGLLEMLTATLLEPHVSLYQSYLGKAYYQAQRFPEGLSALASAKRLDPRDPTPWLYTSLFLRDQNRQVDALNELRTAIDLNDRRAVYRGRLLLDRDLATKNVSLAEIYRQPGSGGARTSFNSLRRITPTRARTCSSPKPTACCRTARRRSAASCCSTSCTRPSTGTRSTTSPSTRRCSSSRGASSTRRWRPVRATARSPMSPIDPATNDSRTACSRRHPGSAEGAD